MPKRSSKPGDVNQLAAAIRAQATDDEPPAEAAREKDPAAVSLGRRGGLKGGKARAEALSPDERQRIAKAAATARWGSKKPPGQ